MLLSQDRGAVRCLPNMRGPTPVSPKHDQLLKSVVSGIGNASLRASECKPSRPRGMPVGHVVMNTGHLQLQERSVVEGSCERSSGEVQSGIAVPSSLYLGCNNL